MSYLTLIPARTGSVRVPNKNFKLLHGRCLTERTVQCAKEAELSPLILTDLLVPRLFDCPTLFVDPHPDGEWLQLFWKIKEAIKAGAEGDPIILLEPTAALRRPDHVLSGILEYKLSGASSCVSVVEEIDGWGKRDGTFYIFARNNLSMFGNIYGPTCFTVKVPAHESLNVNTLKDWDRAEQLLAPTLQAHSQLKPQLVLATDDTPAK